MVSLYNTAQWIRRVEEITTTTIQLSGESIQNGLQMHYNTLETPWGRVVNNQSITHHDHSDARGRIQLVLPLRPSTQGCVRGRGVQGILILLYSYHYEQGIRVREEPTKGGARACVTGERVNALQMCIWLKIDL